MQVTIAHAQRIVPPAVVVHGASDLHRAIDAARETGLPLLMLLSAPDAACFLGPAWWRALMALAASRVRAGGLALEDVLDCGDAAGRALEALRLGQRRLVLAPTGQWHTVQQRTIAVGAVLLAARPPALDLAESGAHRLLSAWLRPRAAAVDDRSEPPG